MNEPDLTHAEAAALRIFRLCRMEDGTMKVNAQAYYCGESDADGTSYYRLFNRLIAKGRIRMVLGTNGSLQHMEETP